MCLCTTVLALGVVCTPLLMRLIINDVIANHNVGLMPIIIVAYITITIANAGFGYIQTILMAYVGQSFVMRIRLAVYEHVLRLGMAYLGKESTGKLLNRIMGDSDILQGALTATTLTIISDLICSVVAVSATLFINWRLAIPLYIIIILFVVNFRMKIGGLKRVWYLQRLSEDRLATGVQNRLTANLTVKTYGMEDREGESFHTQSSESLMLGRDRRIRISEFWRNTELLRDAGSTIIFFIGCGMVLNGSTQYGDVTAFCSYSTLLLWPAVRFTQVIQQLQDTKIAADRLFEILDEEPTIRENDDPIQLKECKGEIKFEDIHFGYIPEKEVIRGISLDVKQGETIALVGATGCGKSTILSLIMRMYDVTSGRITIDGHDVRDLSLKSLRSHFGIVLQESLLFSVSIADNIRYARPQATQEEVEFAAKIAEIHNEIKTLPRGYASCIGDHDVQLSVGQKQRISIAREVLANPAILIMDEATSSLDSNSERAIQQALDKFLKNRTAFIVAHRLSTIRSADKIILLDSGHIVEMGSHNELIKIENGRYKKLYETHSGQGIIKEDAEETT